MRIDQIALDLLEDLEQNEEPKGFNRIHRQDDQRAGQPANDGAEHRNERGEGGEDADH